MRLANPAHIKAVPGRKSDVNDAQWIAELLAHGLITGSFVPETPIQELRELTRTRKQLIAEKARYTQRIQKTLEDANIKLSSVATDILGVSGRSIVNALIAGRTDPIELAALAKGKLKNKSVSLQNALFGRVSSHHQFMLEVLLEQIHAIETSLARFETRITELMLPFKSALEHLITIPGVGIDIARVIIAEIGTDMSRFPSADHLVSWAGLCPKLDESAGKRKSTRVKQGDSWLKTMLVQASMAASRCKSGYLQSRFRRLRVHRGFKKAIVANAAFILKAVWHMLTRGQDFKDLGDAYFESRSRDKRIAGLKGQLESLGLTVVLSNTA
jgi:transposase